MYYELKEDALNGQLMVSDSFSKAHQLITLHCYTFIWNRGRPKHWEIDLIPIEIPTHSIFSLSPGQSLSLSNQTDDYIVIQFNREFYCVQDHDHEVSCNGILFNGALSTPILVLNEHEQRSFWVLLHVIEEEFSHKDEVQLEMLKTVLKRFIIKCTRLAKQQFADKLIDPQDLDTVRHFSALVEKHFKTLHKVNEYANLMNKSPKTLSNVFNQLGEKTPLKVIHERIVLEAKKLLLFTDKSSKEITFELGFSDPVQFSRLFKNETGYSPIDFRKQGILAIAS
jgi:AraC family transcriptional regulator, transcriptional activator of pobA